MVDASSVDVPGLAIPDKTCMHSTKTFSLLLVVDLEGIDLTITQFKKLSAQISVSVSNQNCVDYRNVCGG